MKQCAFRNCTKEASEKGLCHEHYKAQENVDMDSAPDAAHAGNGACKKCGAKKDEAGGRFYKGVCVKCRRGKPATQEKKPVVKAPYIALSPQVLIAMECDRLKAMLLDKNRKYGNSALDPCRVFSKADMIEQINVRLDDKLSRMASAQGDDYEDAEFDFIGYLLLKRVARTMRAA